MFAPVRSQTAFEETVERLGTAIKLGLLAPGTQLPAERELCARLGIARSTLRQALIALGQSGHVFATRGRGGGTFVSDPQPPTDPPSAQMLAQWRETCDLRLAVELGVAVLAAERADSAELDALDEVAATLEATLEDFGAYRQADIRLHVGLAEATRTAAAGARDDRGAGRDDRPDRLHRTPARRCSPPPTHSTAGCSPRCASATRCAPRAS